MRDQGNNADCPHLGRMFVLRGSGRDRGSGDSVHKESSKGVLRDKGRHEGKWMEVHLRVCIVINRGVPN